MWLSVQINVGCYAIHEIRLILFLSYHGIYVFQMGSSVYIPPSRHSG